MAVEKLPVPNIQLETSDFGTVFQQKMNDAMLAVRDAIIAYNNQVDAYLTAADFTEIASTAQMLAGTNNTLRVTPLRVKEALDARDEDFGSLAYLDEGIAAGNVQRLGSRSTNIETHNIPSGAIVWDASTSPNRYKNGNCSVASFVSQGASDGTGRYGFMLAGREGFGLGVKFVSNSVFTPWYDVFTTLNLLNIGTTPASARSVLQLGTASQFNIGLNNGEVPQAQMFGTAAWEMTSNLLSRSSHTGSQPLSTISDAGTAAAYNEGVSSGNIQRLGPRSWGLDTHEIPSGAVVWDNSPSTNRYKGGNSAVASFIAQGNSDGTGRYGFMLAGREGFGLGVKFVGNSTYTGWFEVLTTANQLTIGTTAASARDALQLKNMAQRSLTVSSAAPTTAQINAMAEGDLWGVYS